MGKMPSANDDNPYEPPKTQSAIPARIPSRFHAWLVDRIMLVGCGCLGFIMLWGIAILIALVFHLLR